MKTKLLIMLFLLSTGIVFTGCNQKKQYRPDTKIVNAFNTKYPKADRVEWEQKHGYYVADYHENNLESEAWFDQAGKWMMTETNMKYNQLPQAIRTHFEQGSYSNWKKDDVDKIERVGMQPVYVIEIEKEGQDTDLYYSANGQLVKTVNDVKRNDNYNYLPIPAVLSAKIKEKYPDATIIETENEHGKTEIDILQNGKSKEVIFNGNNWESTSWKVRKSEVPSVVMEALRKSEYGKYRIDDIYFYETTSDNYYLFDLEQGDSEVHISINLQGNIEKRRN